MCHCKCSFSLVTACMSANYIQLMIVFYSDPETISIQASADYDEENNTGSWSTLASLSSASVYTTRNESQDILFDNSVLYSHYRFIFRRKDNYSTMKIGHVGVVESYLKKYAVDLFGRIANSDVLGLPTNVPSADPSAGPSSGPTNAPTATPISLEPTESPSISSNPTYPIFPEFINEAAGGPLQVAVDMWRYNRPLALQTYGDIKYWRTGRVVWMKNLFYYKEGFNEDTSLWDASNVTTMSNVFNHAYVFNANLNMWNTGKVKTMEAMFHATQRFNSDIGNWDTSQVTTFQSMFNAAAVFNKDISTWDTGEAEKLIHMFSETNHFNIDISPWNISKVTNMHRMFRSAIGFNQDICWDTSGKVVTEVFSYCPGGSFCV